MKSRILSQHELKMVREYHKAGLRYVRGNKKQEETKVSDEIFVYVGAYRKDSEGLDKLVSRNDEKALYVEYCSVDDNNKNPLVVLPAERALVFEAEHYVVFSRTPKDSQEDYYKFFREFKKAYDIQRSISEEEAASYAKQYFRK